MTKSFNNLYCAIDYASWENFVRGSKQFKVFERHKNLYIVEEVVTGSKKRKGLIQISEPYYENLSYDHLKSVSKEFELERFMENIKGAFSNMSNQELLFILNKRIPIIKFIRLEIANRGFDEHNDWVGFTAAEKIWCK